MLCEQAGLACAGALISMLPMILHLTIQSLPFSRFPTIYESQLRQCVTEDKLGIIEALASLPVLHDGTPATSLRHLGHWRI